MDGVSFASFQMVQSFLSLTAEQPTEFGMRCARPYAVDITEVYVSLYTSTMCSLLSIVTCQSFVFAELDLTEIYPHSCF